MSFFYYIPFKKKKKYIFNFCPLYSANASEKRNDARMQQFTVLQTFRYDI